jgi:hypothetical protein
LPYLLDSALVDSLHPTSASHGWHDLRSGKELADAIEILHEPGTGAVRKPRKTWRGEAAPTDTSKRRAEEKRNHG